MRRGGRMREPWDMPFWQRLVITVAAMIGTSFVVGLIWDALRRLADPELPERHHRRADRAAGLGVPQAGRAEASGRRAAGLRAAMRLAAHPADSPYQTGLERNPANHAPLTPISFLERAADVFPDRTAWIHGDARASYAAFRARARRLAAALVAPRRRPGRHGRGDAAQHPADAGGAFRRADGGRACSTASTSASSPRPSPISSPTAGPRCC